MKNVVAANPAREALTGRGAACFRSGHSRYRKGSKELSLTGSFRFHEEFFTGVSLMRKGLIGVAPLITHVFGLDEAETAFLAAGDRGRAMKAQLRFGTEC